MIKVYNFDGKTIEDAIKKATEKLEVSEKEIITKETEGKTGLFKTKKVEINVVLIDEIISNVKEYIIEITKLMNMKINIETKRRDESILFMLHSDNNPILIGRNGKTIDAIQTLTKQAVCNQTGMYINFIVDVAEYKLKQKNNIEYIAERTAREVEKTKIEVKLDNMNSYERRLVHATLTDYPGIYTESVGEEPNRSVIIKPKKEN